MKQFIEMMKTKTFTNTLILSYLCILTPVWSLAQEPLFHAHSAEIAADMPASSCFAPTYAGVHFRNDFGTKEMMFAELLASWNCRKNVLLISLNHYGYVNYGDMQLGVGYGRNFGNRFAMTARVFYLMSHARKYPIRHSLCVDFAIACKASPKCLFSTAVYNPFMLHYGIVGQEVIPLKFLIGCAYTPTRKLLLSLSMAKWLPGTWEIDCLFMTQPIPALLLATNCSNSRVGVFIGLTYKKFLFFVEAAWHYRISVSPQIGGFYFHEETTTMKQ